MNMSRKAALAAALSLGGLAMGPPMPAAAQYQAPQRPPATPPATPAPTPATTTTPPPALPPPAEQSPVERRFAELDTNDDGRVSADEHAAGRQALFAEMDDDRNGQLSAAEFEAAFGPQRDGMASAADRIRPMDLNGDGMLSDEEHRRGMEGQFQRNDTNRDDALDLAEMKSSTAEVPNPP